MRSKTTNAAAPQAGEHFDRLYHMGYRLKGVVSLKKTGEETAHDPVAVAILRHVDKRRGGAFLSVIHERGGDWLYSDAVPYVGGGVRAW